MPLERPTGDVEPPTCGGWGYVAKWGRWGYFPKYEDLNVVARLAGYEYMRPFYEEMFRCKVDGVYAYSASIKGGDADSRQIAAVIKLLDEILRIMSAWITTTMVAEVEQKYREARNMYDTLMRDADAVEFNRADMETLHSAAMIASRVRGGANPDVTLSRHPARATARRLPPPLNIGLLPSPVDPIGVCKARLPNPAQRPRLCSLPSELSRPALRL